MTSSAFEIYDTWATVYKYRAVNSYSISILQNHELYFASPKQLNDPHDCQINVIAALKEAISNFDLTKAPHDRRETINQVAEELKNESVISKKIQQLIDERSICSFSILSDNPLMWAHYADSHRGFCLGFDPKLLEEYTIGGFDNIYPHAVVYTDGNPFNATLQRFVDSFYESYPSRKRPSTRSLWRFFIEDAVGSKSLSWSYEKEFRFIRIEGGCGVVKFIPDALVEVVLGCNMFNQDRKAIIDMLKAKEWSNVRIREVIKSPTTFSFKIEDI
jgi:hypothetical protein